MFTRTTGFLAIAIENFFIACRISLGKARIMIARFIPRGMLNIRGFSNKLFTKCRITVTHHEKQSDNNIGYDVLTETYVNMLSAGIIDPAKVTRGALENAASIAAMILTTEALITDLPEENEMPMPGGMPPGGMGV